MIDLVVMLQAACAGIVLWRAAHERLWWDQSGFALLSAACALVTWRRVTERMDAYSGSAVDNVVLPRIITLVLFAAAICFAIEMVRRLTVYADQHRNPGSSGPKRYLIPFCVVFFVFAVDFAPAQWNGQGAAMLTSEQARHAALFGPNDLVATEQLRWDASVSIDTLIVLSCGTGVKADVAKMKLHAIAIKTEPYLR